MNIREKLIILIGSILFFLSVIFLLCGAAFSIHETLLVDRHQLNILAEHIDGLVTEDYLPPSTKETILRGIPFSIKPERINIAIYTKDGKLLLKKCQSSQQLSFPEKHPSSKKDFIVYSKWYPLEKWSIDYSYFGANCVVRIIYLRRIEIHEDLIAAVLICIPVIFLLSFFGAGLITGKMLRRIQNISSVASNIAMGHLSARIPIVQHKDEITLLEQNLNHTFSELELSFDKIMYFSSEVAHELRTPLTAILGNMEVALRETRSVEEYQETLAMSIEELSLLRKLIDDMLILVKPHSAYRKGQFTKVNFSNIVEKTLSQLDFFAEDKKIKLISVIPPDIMISGVESFLLRLVYNLVHNAIKFSPLSSVVEIRLKEEKSIITLSVIDNGTGIPDDKKDRIFDRFYRFGKDSNTGSGLGLAIVKWVAELHGGTVSVNSSISGGSEFTVEFQKTCLKNWKNT